MQSSTPTPGAGIALPPRPATSAMPARTGHLKDILAPSTTPEPALSASSAQTQAARANIAPQVAAASTIGGPTLSQTSPNTAYSPQAAQPSPVTNPGQPLVRRSEPGRMRASIACGHCRRSKIKCENSGQKKPCKGCLNAGRQCTYGPSESTGQGRRQSIAAPRGDASNGTSGTDSHRAKRSKKTHAPSLEGSYDKEGSTRLSDIFDPQLLTVKVWKELLATFAQHYSVDFQFFHPMRFKRNLDPDPPGAPVTVPTYPWPKGIPDQAPEFLLAFLALTARFNDSLVAHFSQNPDDRVAASEYYASEARARLYRRGRDALPTKSLVRAQAHLMLAMHEHIMGRGEDAYIDVGRAIEQVHFEMIHHDQDLDKLSRRSVGLSQSRGEDSLNKHGRTSPRQKSDFEEEHIDQEIRRRTLWSCFFLDKYMSNGENRPARLTVDQFRTQLPGSNKIFLFGENIKTKLLHEGTDKFNERFEKMRRLEQSLYNGARPDDRAGHKIPVKIPEPKAEIHDSEGHLSHGVRALDLYGRINLWCCTGGRKSGSAEEQKIPPWDSRSKAYQLYKELEDFERGLPAGLTYSDHSTRVHADQKETATTYIIINLVIFLGTFLLHREYLPCHPWEKVCPRPIGPIEGPRFSDPPDPMYWEVSARRCFRAARDIVELLYRCQELDILPETPFVAYTAWSATFAGIYSWVYPHMDQDHQMHDTLPSTATVLLEAHGSPFRLVRHFATKMPMARNWCMIAEPMARSLRKMVDRPDNVPQSWFWGRYKELLADLAACKRAEGLNGAVPEAAFSRDASLREDASGTAAVTPPTEPTETSHANGTAAVALKIEPTESPSTNGAPQSTAWTSVNNQSPRSDDSRSQPYTPNFPNSSAQPLSYSGPAPFTHQQYSLDAFYSGPHEEHVSEAVEEMFDYLNGSPENDFLFDYRTLYASWQFPEISFPSADESDVITASFVKHAVKDVMSMNESGVF